MLLRETKRRLADGSTVAYYQLAENTWNPQTRQPETRIVYNLGRVDAEARERLRRLAQSILRRATPEEVVAAAPDMILEDAWPYGGLYVLEALWERRGLRESVAGCVEPERRHAPLERALFAMVANRSLAPRSKLYCYEQWLREEIYFPPGRPLELQHLYRAMDLLEKHHETIERMDAFNTARDGALGPDRDNASEGSLISAKARGSPADHPNSRLPFVSTQRISHLLSQVRASNNGCPCRTAADSPSGLRAADAERLPHPADVVPGATLAAGVVLVVLDLAEQLNEIRAQPGIARRGSRRPAVQRRHRLVEPLREVAVQHLAEHVRFHFRRDGGR